VPDKQGAPRRFLFYDIRHTFGTRLSEAGVPLKMVSKLMGHRNVQTNDALFAHEERGRTPGRTDVQTLMETPEVPGPRLAKKERRSA
jgi:integrase